MQEIIEQFQRENRHNQKLVSITIFNTILSVVVLVFLLLLCQCTYFTQMGDDIPDATIPQFDITMDPDINGIECETTSIQEIQEELRRQVEEGMMNISMNSNPVFENGSAVGNLLITNADFNKYAQVVEIYRDDTGEMIYRSDVIPVGAHLDEAKLSVNLHQGVYNCTAHFNQIADDGTLLGKAYAKIQIYILN